MRKYIIACLILCSAITAEAQYIPAFQKDAIIRKDPGMSYWTKGNSFKHLELSLTLGTSGVGLDVAVPVSQIVQVRIGYDYMPQFKK